LQVVPELREDLAVSCENSLSIAVNSCIALTLARFFSARRIHGGFFGVLSGGLGGGSVELILS
jgi:hypothetical protein